MFGRLSIVSIRPVLAIIRVGLHAFVYIAHGAGEFPAIPSAATSVPSSPPSYTVNPVLAQGIAYLIAVLIVTWQRACLQGYQTIAPTYVGTDLGPTIPAHCLSLNQSTVFATRASF